MNSRIAPTIDHSLLQPALTDDQLRAGCQLALEWQVASVCIKPYAVSLAARMLRGSAVAVGTVVGFPHGGHDTRTKVFEAGLACDEGARELDMVVNVGRVLSGDWQYVEQDIAAVIEVARRREALMKVIFENDLLPDDAAKLRLCQVCTQLGANWVKTSTGYGFVRQPDGQYNYRGATEHDIRLMLANIGPKVQVKAAGGVRDYESAVRMIELGVTRIGTTATEAILTEDAAA